MLVVAVAGLLKKLPPNSPVLGAVVVDVVEVLLSFDLGAVEPNRPVFSAGVVVVAGVEESMIRSYNLRTMTCKTMNILLAFAVGMLKTVEIVI